MLISHEHIISDRRLFEASDGTSLDQRFSSLARISSTIISTALDKI